MSLITCTVFRIIQQNHVLHLFRSVAKTLCKAILILGLILYVIYVLLPNHPCCYSFTAFSTHLLSPKVVNVPMEGSSSTSKNDCNSTNISHIAFAITSSSETWRTRRCYTETWWRPNVTRGYVFFDHQFPAEFLPWSPSSPPPFRISENTTSKYKDYDKHKTPQAIRMMNSILEIFRLENEGVRWYIMADDDTVLFIDNVVQVLGRYDHNKYFYIGMNSECHASNVYNAFEMAFGGAGYALSYPLARALANNLDVCIKRYPTLYGSDHIVQSCVADLGVSLTRERGFHQIDLHGDISGLLSAHPKSPLLSLHHFEHFDPIFPSMIRNESVRHLMKAAKADESRLLQQTICYHKQKNWSFSISWGYTTQIYEAIHPPSFLQLPLETFWPWSKSARPFFLMNTRIPSRNPCEMPHVFYFDSVEEIDGHSHITIYIRKKSRMLPACSSTGNHSAEHINTIHVFSPVKKHEEVGSRRECCDVKYESGLNTTEIKLRTCLEDEIIPSV